MAKLAHRKTESKRATIYARVSDKSQDAEDKTSISEQISDMEAHCQRRGLTIVARYQEVGRGWSKKSPEFQRMPADARQGRFDTIVCWKSDRLSRGMYPAAALMEVVEAHRINLRSRNGRHRHEDLRSHGRSRQDRAGQDIGYPMKTKDSGTRGRWDLKPVDNDDDSRSPMWSEPSSAA